MLALFGNKKDRGGLQGLTQYTRVVLTPRKKITHKEKWNEIFFVRKKYNRNCLKKKKKKVKLRNAFRILKEKKRLYQLDQLGKV